MPSFQCSFWGDQDAMAKRVTGVDTQQKWLIRQVCTRSDEPFLELTLNCRPHEVLSRMKPYPEVRTIWIITDEDNDEHGRPNPEGLARIRKMP